MRAIVVGGGVGGLATAIGLVRRGWRGGVFERAEGSGEVGSVLSLSPNGVRALGELGVGGRAGGGGGGGGRSPRRAAGGPTGGGGWRGGRKVGGGERVRGWCPRRRPRVHVRRRRRARRAARTGRRIRGAARSFRRMARSH